MKRSLLVVLFLVAIPACSFSETPSISWTPFEDRGEGAFTIDVPQGWAAEGGTYRFGYFDVRWMMDVHSPDGKILVRLNDANVPPYELPAPSLPPEGQPYSKPQQFQMVVSRYRDGSAFAQTYGKERFKSVCRNVTVKDISWKPKPQDIPAGATVTQKSEGTFSYTCDTEDGPRVAEIYARTVSFPVQYGTGFWVTDPLVSILATPENSAAAEAVAQHMIESWKKNPQWETRQQQLTQAGAQLIQQNFQQFMGQIQAFHQARVAAWNNQVAGFEAHQNAQAS